ncbi:MAG: bifunctional phosphoribosyl-AMP cyclohydrolase/phosphoribosyl-ATP diphosphatase HisIE [Oscillospiraceae bacterium]|nr:bifunctional phosphoribosyl-AMP cyclohydrolase/phosphoribosyl-ATP diphosphatase HisIE [Oscillospiraceae bacterium]
MLNCDQIKFGADGLVPAIVQDESSGSVLTLAYMNRESLEITLKEGYTCFYSRSRNALWRKGESSGNVQKVVSITADCDLDALLVKVIPAGPACHTGAESCFYQSLFMTDQPGSFSLQSLYELLAGRKSEPKPGSYTSYLFEKGEDKILKKIGEEAAEVLIAAKNDDNRELTCELADLCYHALVLMVERGLPLGQVRDELAGRHLVDKKIKQEKMGGEAQ